MKKHQFSYIFGAAFIILIIIYLKFFLSKKIETMVLNTLQMSNASSVNKFIEQQKKLDKLLVDAERKSGVIDRQIIMINGLVNGLRGEHDLVQVQSGYVGLSTQEFPDMNLSAGCKGKKGIVDRVIMFDSPFISKPHVLTSFQTIDFGNGPDHRLKTTINNINKVSFTLSFHSWCDTRMSQAKLNWIAIGL